MRETNKAVILRMLRTGKKVKNADLMKATSWDFRKYVSELRTDHGLTIECTKGGEGEPSWTNYYQLIVDTNAVEIVEEHGRLRVKGGEEVIVLDLQEEIPGGVLFSTTHQEEEIEYLKEKIESVRDYSNSRIKELMERLTILKIALAISCVLTVSLIAVEASHLDDNMKCRNGYEANCR